MGSNIISYDVSEKSIIERLYLNIGLLFYGAGLISLIYIRSVYPGAAMSWALGAYCCFFAYYAYLRIRGRKHMVYRAVLQDGVVTAYTPAGERSVRLADVILCLGYSTTSFVCNVLVTEDDYLVLNLSSAYVFTKGGQQKLTPFYALAKQCRAQAPRFENVVKSNRVKRHPWIRIPFAMYEWDCRSARVDKHVNKLREECRKRQPAPQ